METLRNASLFALLSLALAFTPLVMAMAYVIKPSERRLALMRPISLAGLFAALTGGVLGFLNVLRYFGVRSTGSFDSYRAMAIGAAESLVPMFVGFGCLTIAWLLVALGMSRQGREG